MHLLPLQEVLTLDGPALAQDIFPSETIERGIWTGVRVLPTTTHFPIIHTIPYWTNYVAITTKKLLPFLLDILKNTPFNKYNDIDVLAHKRFEEILIDTKTPLFLITVLNDFNAPWKPVMTTDESMVISIFTEECSQDSPDPWYSGTYPHKLLQVVSYYQRFYNIRYLFPWEGIVYTSGDSEKLLNPPSHYKLVESHEKDLLNMTLSKVTKIKNPINNNFLIVRKSGRPWQRIPYDDR